MGWYGNIFRLWGRVGNLSSTSHVVSLVQSDEFDHFVFIFYINSFYYLLKCGSVHCKISSGCVDLLALIFSYCSIKKTES